MKNVLRLCLFIFVIIHLLISTQGNIAKRGSGDLSITKLSRIDNYRDIVQTFKGVKGHKIFFLGNKKNILKEIWEKFSSATGRYDSRYNRKSSDKTKEGWSKISLKKVFSNFRSNDNDIIDKAVLTNSTVINEAIFSVLLKRNNLDTIQYKDINRIVKIVNDYYNDNNYLFSNVSKYEVKKEGNKKTLVIHVSELILHKNCIKINVYRTPKKGEAVKVGETGKREDTTKESEPAKVGKTDKKEDTTKESEPAKVGKTDKKEETTKESEPAKVGKTDKKEETTKESEPAKVGETDKKEETTKESEPAKVGETDKKEETTKESKSSKGGTENMESEKVINLHNGEKAVNSQNRSSSSPGGGKILFERKSIVNGEVLNHGLKEMKGMTSTKLKKFFEKKMNLKENCIFVWNEKMYDLLIKSNLFCYVHVKLISDKRENKTILEIDLVENKKVLFIPSISKSFNSLLEFCMNLTFAYLHSINYADKFRIKLFQNLNYKNNKHNYDFVFVNDIVEIEKLKRNYFTYTIYGINVNKIFKKEINNYSLNELIHIMKSKSGKNDFEKKPSDDKIEMRRIPSTHLLHPSMRTKDIYNYLSKNKIFFFFVKKMYNSIYEIKVKVKRKSFHNFFYFLKGPSTENFKNNTSNSEEGHNINNDNTNGINTKIKNFFPLKYLIFLKKENKNVIFNGLYNVYGSKIKLSSSLNAFSPNIFEKLNFLKTFFNIKNKIDLVFYFNTDKKFCIKKDINSSGEIIPGEQSSSYSWNCEKVRSNLVTFFKEVNKGWFFPVGKIHNVYLNYSFYFSKNYNMNLSGFFVNIKNNLRKITKLGQRKEKKIYTNNLHGEEKIVCIIPMYLFRLALHDAHLVLNLEFFFKKNLWNYKQGYNYERGKNEKKEKETKKWPSYKTVKKIFDLSKKNVHDSLDNFRENVQRVKVLSDVGPSTGSCPSYDIHSINLNDAQKEYLNKMKFSLNYKLIFPLMFNSYLLNLLNMKLYFFLNHNLFGDGHIDSGAASGAASGTANGSNGSRGESDTCSFLKTSYLKRGGGGEHNSSYGMGVLLSNINVFLKFKLSPRKMFPSLILQLNQDQAKFKYLL
ncbi:conserved Plasmodium protein, unknown function [Plasmodium ovale wallikeri]|uniref:Protein TOC75 n=1 Tax=Plasmodium ovale wallikeri TaxID=864142 RepID=A0A1A9A0F6_PLAOA|nr:conserved Plasmodium protein, unknown function [Plasmodium ovale wallikeri]